ncbi:rod shape-determining protein RodA, partial [Lentimicrobium sp. L6]
ILTLLVGKLTMLISVALIAVLLFLLMKKVRKNILSLLAILVLVGGFIFSIDYAFENILQEHQKTRIEVLLGMKTDYRGAGYNVHQSLIAIGSGGPTGKGFLQGTQTKYNFVPEQSTDFIFCTVGEEWGFLGTATVVILFLFLLIRIIIVAERQRSSFSRIYGYGVASILFFHFSINIAMTIGLAPVIGIPLPFFSYGGSSLWSFTVLLFIFIKMDSYRLELL